MWTHLAPSDAHSRVHNIQSELRDLVRTRVLDTLAKRMNSEVMRSAGLCLCRGILMWWTPHILTGLGNRVKVMDSGIDDKMLGLH